MNYHDAHFSIVSNVFYMIPMIPALMFKWFLLFFVYLCIFITSTIYHVCENIYSCAFGWDVITWRILDHIFAWYGIALSLLHVCLPEIYMVSQNELSENYIFVSNYKSHDSKEIKISSNYTKNYKVLLNFFLAFLNILILTEIVYFSNGMIDSFPVPQITILLTTIIGILLIRFFIYKLKKSSRWTTIFCPPIKNPALIIFSLVVLAIASNFFIVKEDSRGITHGEWHYFSSLAGGLMILSLY